MTKALATISRQFARALAFTPAIFSRYAQRDTENATLSIRPSVGLITVGIFLVFACVAIRLVSPSFYYGALPTLDAILSLVGLMMLAGIIYLTLFVLIPKLKDDRRLLSVAMIIGIFMRLLFFGSTPIYEDDWYRYLWDGSSVNAGINPYTYSPADASLIDAFGGEPLALSSDPDLRTLQTIGSENPTALERVNYPHVSTIYPPLAQASFAAANKIKAFDLNAWRAILLLTDIAMMFVLLGTITALNRKKLWALLYWWNPLAIMTIFNAGHMDVLIGPFIIGAIWLVVKNRPASAGICLAAATSVKLWPLVLAPVLFSKWRTHPRILFTTALILLGAVALLLAPMLMSLDWDRSGLTAYAQSWRKNAFLFPLLANGIDFAPIDGDFWA